MGDCYLQHVNFLSMLICVLERLYTVVIELKRPFNVI